MKKLTIDPRFWLTAAFCAALLAAPPLLTQAWDRQADTTALTRPAVAGVMTDEERLDPTISALYSQKILSASNVFLVGEKNSYKYTAMSGKLKQAYNRGLLSEGQLDALLTLVSITKAAQDSEDDSFSYTGLNTCYASTDTAGVEQLQLSHCSATPDEIASPEFTPKLTATIYISYLPNNGPILSMTISYDDLPESTVDLETLQDRFCDQLKLTVPGEWTDIGGGQRNYSSSNLCSLVDACTATHRGILMMALLNPFVNE